MLLSFHILRRPVKYFNFRTFAQSATFLLFKNKTRVTPKINLPPCSPYTSNTGSLPKNTVTTTTDSKTKFSTSDNATTTYYTTKNSSEDAKASKTADSQDVTTATFLSLDPKYDDHKILRRIPPILRPYTTNFILAPASHTTAFLILHELTAIVPLIAVWYVLHQYHDTLMTATLDLPTWAVEKGTKVIENAMRDLDFGDYSVSDKMKYITEGAYAYVIVKALFPVRVAFSIIGMPFFARWFIIPITSRFAKKIPEQETLEAPIQEHSVKKVENPRI